MYHTALSAWHFFGDLEIEICCLVQKQVSAGVVYAVPVLRNTAPPSFCTSSVIIFKQLYVFTKLSRQHHEASERKWHNSVPLTEAVILHAGDTKKDKPSMIEVLITTVLKNPYIWGMALTYFFIYVIRQGVTSW
jgi:hypothetical protein